MFLQLRELNSISTTPTSQCALFYIKEKRFRPDSGKSRFPGITSLRGVRLTLVKNLETSKLG